MDDMQEIMEDFLIEAFEMVEQLDQDLVELESNPEDLDLLNRIFRVAHTIKGSSSFLNFDILTSLTHNMEDVLNKARKGELKITPDIMDVVLVSVDLMKALLKVIQESGTDANSGIDITDVVKKLQAISQGTNQDTNSSSQESPAPASSDDNPLADEPDKDYAHMIAEQVEAEIDRLLKKRQEADKQKRAEKKASEQVADTQAPKPEHPANNEAPAPTPAHASPRPAATKDESKNIATAVEQTVRVDVRRLDHLMNLIGELVLGKNRLIRIYSEVEERYDGEKFLEELNQVVSSVSSVTTDLQLAVMKTRMQPVGKVFNKFPRMVRDLSRDLKKNIDLVITGEETELDKSIVEEIGDPLIHIIRNSCDHGIETPEERQTLGKPEVGRVDLKAYNEGNHIVIEITDDGHGLDPDFLKQKAIEKGLISEKEADNMSDKEALGIIFKPGFSTSKTITNVSGRGVGMDVVKTNVEKLNGIIEIDSEKGVGTTFKLKIPLTLAIMQTLLVGTQE
ncbi:chemotaxis protein CheA, partial [uncultured Helicobacter sp.]|uniref:chemotaxis protein CheA n=1 Tax=uncultured Helicobacter sp. TaxID=175537 RepID=UPI0025967F69